MDHVTSPPSIELLERSQDPFQSRVTPNKKSRFSPKVDLFIEKNNYIIKTASTIKEYKQAFQLRFDIFYKEKANLGSHLIGFDYDIYDEIGDLIIIVDAKTKDVIGTYRIIASSFASQYYSQSEFDISMFLDRPEGKAEVSRACVHPDHRNGATLSLLWHGIIKYTQMVNARFLFGCSSVWTQKKEVAASVMQWLSSKDQWSDKLFIHPLVKYRKDLSGLNLAGINAKDHVAPLLRAYLRAGAKVQGEPAYDKIFGCFDFFTLLDLEHFGESFRRRYC